MELLNQFGFDLKLFIAQAVNFLILAYIFKRFLYKPLLNIFKEREEKIKVGLENADKAREALESAKHDRSEILKKSRADADEIIANTRKLAEEMKQEFTAKSRAESDKILSEAKSQAVEQMKLMEKEVKNMSLDLSKKILDDIMAKLFTEEEKQKIMKRAAESINKQADKL
jgi:F-type H+-transporting ATPase subunit b